MASYVLKSVLFLLLAAGAAFGEMCSSCHESHYEDSGPCTSCHRGSGKSRREALAHYKMIPGDYAGYMIRGNIITEKGKKIIEEAKCRRCHTVGGEGGVKASNLDSSSERLPPDKLLDAIENPNDNMPDFRLDTENLKALMSGLYFYASGSVVMEMTQTVHFIGEEKDGTFHKKCGGCHKALTAEGAAGTYKWGPNLSGIGEKDDYGINGVQWDEELLEKWLRNSRDVKKNSAMPPADLTEEELRSVIRTLTGNR